LDSDIELLHMFQETNNRYINKKKHARQRTWL